MAKQQTQKDGGKQKRRKTQGEKRPAKFKVYQRLDLEKYLKERIIGQDAFIRKVLIALYRRLIFRMRSNIMVVGGSGTGKTETIKEIAEVLNIPYTIENATEYTQAGYVGSSVEDMVYNLYENAKRMKNTKILPFGIIIIDEIDKKAEDDSVGRGDSVAGKAVQQSLLKLIDGMAVPIYDEEESSKQQSAKMKKKKAKEAEEKKEMTQEETEHEKNKSAENSVLEELGVSVYYPGEDDFLQPVMTIDTSYIIFVCIGAFEGLSEIRDERLNKHQIGFKKDGGKDKIAEFTEADFTKYGMIKEFIGRMDCIAETRTLVEDDIEKIITDSKISEFKLYEEALAKKGVEIAYSANLIKQIAKKACSLQIGARGIKTVVNSIFEGILCDVIDNSDDVRTKCILEDDIVNDNTKYYYVAE